MRVAHVRFGKRITVETLLSAAVGAGLDLLALQADLLRLELPGQPELFGSNVDGSPCQVMLAVMDAPAWPLAQLESHLAAPGLPRSAIDIMRRACRRWLGEDQGRSVPAEVVAGIAALACAWGQLGIARTTLDPLAISAASASAVADLVLGYRVSSGEALLERDAVAALTTLAVSEGMPNMVLRQVGLGVDGLELWLGEVDDLSGLERRTLLMLETNIDDMNPEFYDHLMAQCFAAGALDVFLVPMQMKKNRPAILMRALCAPDGLDAVMGAIFAGSTTLGVRVQELARYALPRRYEQVETPWGTVQVKVALLPDGTERPVPEYEDCRRLAEASGEPIWRVYNTAQAAALGE